MSVVGSYCLSRSHRVRKLVWEAIVERRQCRAPLLIAAFMLLWAVFSCCGETIIVSGAGYGEVNGTYTYNLSIAPSAISGIESAWLGPKSNLIHGMTLYWALLGTGSDANQPNIYWILVIMADPHTEPTAYVMGDGFYENRTVSFCPPKTGWTGGTAPAPTIIHTSCLCPTLADVNDDGHTDLVDVRMIYAHATGSLTLPDEMLARADADDDGDVDLDDARLVAEWDIEVCSD